MEINGESGMIENDDINYLIRRYRAIAKTLREDTKKFRASRRTDTARAETFELVAGDLERMLVWRENKSMNQKRKEIGLDEILWPN